MRTSSIPARRAARRGSLLGAVLIAAAVALAGPAPAHAAGLLATGACDDAALTQPFASWGDSAPYKLMPGGDFEGSLAGWSLTGGAAVVSDGTDHVVSLPAGASLTSPATCVNTSYPTFRVFAKNTKSLGTVLVQAVYRLPILGNVALPVGVVTLNGTWSPSLPMLTGSTVAGVFSGGTANVSVRFTALTGTTALDDVFVDPRMR